VGVKIYETRSHSQAVRFDYSMRAGRDPADLGNPITHNGDVSDARRQPAAVVNPATLDYQIVSHD
jgi:hypothetical protein